MRFMILVKASANSEAGVMPEEALFAAMADFHEQLARAGALLDAAGLKPSSAGWRVQWEGGRQRVIDGPFTETREIVAGYTLIDVRSREEALEWSRRFPAPHGPGVDAQIEVRPLYELDDLEPSDAIERFRALENDDRSKTMKQTMHFEIEIDAPRRAVWGAMLGPDTYRDWTAAFCEGSYYEGSWEAGQRIRFLGPGGQGGMVAEIAENRPLEFVSIRHLGEIKPGGEEDTTSESVRAWAPAYENYTFSDAGGRTRVQVDMDVLPAYEQFLRDAWPKALARLKALAERG